MTTVFSRLLKEEEKRHAKSKEKMLRDLIISGALNIDMLNLLRGGSRDNLQNRFERVVQVLYGLDLKYGIAEYVRTINICTRNNENCEWLASRLQDHLRNSVFLMATYRNVTIDYVCAYTIFDGIHEECDDLLAFMYEGGVMVSSDSCISAVMAMKKACYGRTGVHIAYRKNGDNNIPFEELNFTMSGLFSHFIILPGRGANVSKTKMNPYTKNNAQIIEYVNPICTNEVNVDGYSCGFVCGKNQVWQFSKTNA